MSSIVAPQPRASETASSLPPFVNNKRAGGDIEDEPNAKRLHTERWDSETPEVRASLSSSNNTQQQLPNLSQPQQQQQTQQAQQAQQAQQQQHDYYQHHQQQQSHQYVPSGYTDSRVASAPPSYGAQYAAAAAAAAAGGHSYMMQPGAPPMYGYPGYPAPPPPQAAAPGSYYAQSAAAGSAAGSPEAPGYSTADASAHAASYSASQQQQQQLQQQQQQQQPTAQYYAVAGPTGYAFYNTATGQPVSQSEVQHQSQLQQQQYQQQQQQQQQQQSPSQTPQQQSGDSPHSAALAAQHQQLQHQQTSSTATSNANQQQGGSGAQGQQQAQTMIPSNSYYGAGGYAGSSMASFNPNDYAAGEVRPSTAPPSTYAANNGAAPGASWYPTASSASISNHLNANAAAAGSVAASDGSSAAYTQAYLQAMSQAPNSQMYGGAAPHGHANPYAAYGSYGVGPQVIPPYSGYPQPPTVYGGPTGAYMPAAADANSAAALLAFSHGSSTGQPNGSSSASASGASSVSGSKSKKGWSKRGSRGSNRSPLRVRAVTLTVLSTLRTKGTPMLVSELEDAVPGGHRQVYDILHVCEKMGLVARAGASRKRYEYVGDADAFRDLSVTAMIANVSARASEHTTARSHRSIGVLTSKLLEFLQSSESPVTRAALAKATAFQPQRVSAALGVLEELGAVLVTREAQRKDTVRLDAGWTGVTASELVARIKLDESGVPTTDHDDL